ncbi:hypothetical protein [Arthrobacter sp. Helios]|uniref:hypothetical protein n=1 Tax=Arthrobacter sp. Helios TaxID=2828862 RepID=UPI0020570E85|nr:hypothetical protein [Arthrobacter sp. Helios]UPO77369.1 hypothetical protein ArtHe_01185 [Arthrobacter sp. Helios]
MAESGTSDDKPGIYFKKSRIPFGAKFVWGIGLVAAIALLGWLEQLCSWPSWLFGVGSTLAGAGIGLLFAPEPKAVNYSKTADTAVELLLDMKSEFERAQNEVTTAVPSVKDVEASFRLIAAQQAMVQQDERFARSVDDWDAISPGVVDRVVQKRQAAQRRFKELAEGTER